MTNCNTYEQIIHEILANDSCIKPVRMGKDEELLTQLQKTKIKLKKILRKLTIVDLCFQYEYNEYKNKTKLTNLEAIDRAAIYELQKSLYVIKRHVVSTNNEIETLIKRVRSNNYDRDEKTRNAILNKCTKKNQWCDALWKNIMYEYVFKSILRQHYIRLVNEGKSFSEDIPQYRPKQHHESKKNWYQEARENLRSYIEMIAEEAKTKPTYKLIRISEYKKEKPDIEIKKSDYNATLKKFIKQKEETYRNPKSPVTYSVINNMRQHPKYEPNKNCYIICCLCKEKGKTRYFRYLGIDGLKNRAIDIDFFCFTQEEIGEAIEKCLTYPNVKAASTIKLA